MSDTYRRRPHRRTCPGCGQDVMIDSYGTILPHMNNGRKAECPSSRRRYPISATQARLRRGG